MPISRIKTDGIQDDAITSAKIGDTNVATADIANGSVTAAKIADDAVTSAKLDTNIAVAGTLGVTGATSLSNNLSLVKNQAAHTNIDVFNNNGTSSAKGQIRVGYDASNCLEIFRVGNDANIIQNATQNGSIIFQGAGTEMMRMSTAGLHIGGTGAANALDDYEEGTFTPTVDSGYTSPTYSVQAGFYTKIGQHVYFQLHIDINTLGSRNSDQWKLGGLPFTSKNVSHCWGGAFSVYTGGTHDHNFDNSVYWAIVPGTTRVIGYKASGGQYPGNSVSAPTGGFYIAGQYIANA